jgi:uncharacterized protein (TIGR02246 family)
MTRVLTTLSLLVALLAASPLQAAETPQDQLNGLPLLWAQAASVGDMDKLMSLYAPDAFIHVVFTSDELRGLDQIRDYYTKYSADPGKVTITAVEESQIIGGNVGILSGSALVEFPGQQPMTTHFSIVATWSGERWTVQLQHTSRVDE